jgi:hypothetical protein
VPPRRREFLLTALITFAALQALARAAAPSSGAAGAAASVGSENIIAFDLDRLFRGDRSPDGDINYARAEAGRILLKASSHRGMQPEDRTYLARLVSDRTGLAQPEAERRVDDIAARAKENINRARRSAVILALMTGAAALVGAAAAWFAACAGGRHRRTGCTTHAVDWGDGRCRKYYIAGRRSPARLTRAVCWFHKTSACVMPSG